MREEYVPTSGRQEEQTATPLFTATEEHPPINNPLLENAIVPVADSDESVAVSTTGVPYVTGDAGKVKDVVTTDFVKVKVRVDVADA